MSWQGVRYSDSPLAAILEHIPVDPSCDLTEPAEEYQSECDGQLQLIIIEVADRLDERCSSPGRKIRSDRHCSS